MKKGVQTFSTLFSRHIQRRQNTSPGNVGEATRKEGSMPLEKKGTLTVEEFYITFQRDVKTFKEKLPQLIQEFPGEYVAILDGEIVAHMPRWENLIELTQRQYPKKFVFVEKISLEVQAVENMDALEG